MHQPLHPTARQMVVEPATLNQRVEGTAWLRSGQGKVASRLSEADELWTFNQGSLPALQLLHQQLATRFLIKHQGLTAHQLIKNKTLTNRPWLLNFKGMKVHQHRKKSWWQINQIVGS